MKVKEAKKLFENLPDELEIAITDSRGMVFPAMFRTVDIFIESNGHCCGFSDNRTHDKESFPVLHAFPAQTQKGPWLEFLPLSTQNN